MKPSLDTPPASWSLKRTFLTIFLILTVSIWGFSALVVYWEADQESQELFDQSLEESAHLLLALAHHDVADLTSIAPSMVAEPQNNEYSKYLMFQIWSKDQRLLYKSKGAPDSPFSQNGALGFGNAKISAQSWRTYTSWNAEHSLQIQVGEPGGHRKEISERFAYKLFLYASLIIPLMAGIVWWSIQRVFRTLQRSADEVAQRTPDDLKMVTLDGAPTEVRPLLQAINRLFERVSRTLEYEQRFTADAAHELRTPLAAIKTNLQVIQRARNEDERSEAIGGLGISVDRASRLVDQLMTLSRLDPQYNKNQTLLPLDLATLLAEQLSALQAQAKKRRIHFEADLNFARCFLHKDSILILIRNLMDNAFRYTPANGMVKLTCGVENDQVYLKIADSGVGIPPELRLRVFDRFVRLSDASTPGSGLGLSIVKRIVESHHAEISLSDGLNATGSSVEIRFPT